MSEHLETSRRYRDFVNLSSLAAIEPITVDRAKGVELWDTDGKRYLDCFAGISVVNSGHSDARVLAAARAQMDKVVHCGTYLYQLSVVGELAEQLARVTPGPLQKTFFCNSGAEAVEGAMRLARAHTGKSEFIALDLGFHGRTNATLSITGNRKRKQHGGPYLGGVAFAPAPYPYRCRFCHGQCDLSCADAVEDVIDFRTSGDVAAFVAEPVLGEAGIVVPPEGYFTRVKEILDRHGILLILDEVQTGFGRTGTLFAAEHERIEPDIMAMAKGIAAGFPLAGFIARSEVADSFKPGEHLSTFGGNPVSCAAALASLNVIENDRLPERAAELGARLLAQLQRVADRHPLIGEVRGRGLMVGVELVTPGDSRDPASAAAAQAKVRAREMGVLIGVGGFFGNVLRIQPPLVIDENQLDLTVEVLDDVLSEVSAPAPGGSR